MGLSIDSPLFWQQIALKMGLVTKQCGLPILIKCVNIRLKRGLILFKNGNQ